jgi:hypothetical protein
MPGARNQFVLMKASKRSGGDWWSPDDYDVQDSHGKVVGRIMLHPQAPKDQPWFWTITAREIRHQFTITDIQRHANRRWRILRRDGRRHSSRYSLSSRPKPSQPESTASSLRLSLSLSLSLRPGLSPTSLLRTLRSLRT